MFGEDAAAIGYAIIGYDNIIMLWLKSNPGRVSARRHTLARYILMNRIVIICTLLMMLCRRFVFNVYFSLFIVLRIFFKKKKKIREELKRRNLSVLKYKYTRTFIIIVYVQLYNIFIVYTDVQSYYKNESIVIPYTRADRKREYDVIPLFESFFFSLIPRILYHSYIRNGYFY